MPNIWLVAQHEFITNIRKKSFLFAVFGVPLLMAGIFAIVYFVEETAANSGIVAEEMGYIDSADFISLESEKFIPFVDSAAAEAALETGTIALYFEIAPAYFETGEVSLYALENVASDSKREIQSFLIENLSAQLGDDVHLERLLTPVELEVYLQTSQKQLSQTAFFGVIMTPFLFTTILIMALQLTSTFLMSGVVEEKTNRIMEILITSITPYQLLTGKLLGIGALGMLQMLIWLGVALVAATFGGQIEILSGLSFPPDFILFVLLYFILSYFLYSSILAGIGAIVGSEQESRTIAGLVSLFLAIPYFAIMLVFTDPHSPILTALLIFPMTSAMTYLMLYPFTVIPLWQVGISMVVLLFATWFVTWAAARIFRWALLFSGKFPSPKLLLRVIAGKQEIGVTTAAKKEQSA